eukprot:Lithocolla_globosa_v1_NODE_1009_length_2958_cov_13.514296.p2 type:complete len:165 gc:universal NODE_1009_length_2958_cov_13.514296:66-560(+)
MKNVQNGQEVWVKATTLFGAAEAKKKHNATPKKDVWLECTVVAIDGAGYKKRFTVRHEKFTKEALSAKTLFETDQTSVKTKAKKKAKKTSDTSSSSSYSDSSVLTSGSSEGESEGTSTSLSSKTQPEAQLEQPSKEAEPPKKAEPDEDLLSVHGQTWVKKVPSL